MRTTMITQRKEETHGKERWRTIKEDDAPLDQDATVEEDHLRLELQKRNTATTTGFFKQLLFWRKRTIKITQREEVMRGVERWWMIEPRTPIYGKYTDILEASHVYGIGANLP